MNKVPGSVYSFMSEQTFRLQHGSGMEQYITLLSSPMLWPNFLGGGQRLDRKPTARVTPRFLLHYRDFLPKTNSLARG